MNKKLLRGATLLQYKPWIYISTADLYLSHYWLNGLCSSFLFALSSIRSNEDWPIPFYWDRPVRDPTTVRLKRHACAVSLALGLLHTSVVLYQNPSYNQLNRNSMFAPGTQICSRQSWGQPPCRRRDLLPSEHSPFLGTSCG